MVWAEIIPVILLAVFGVLVVLMLFKGRTAE
jgi:hypothetical protein